jgi:hypothetical protein
MEKRLEHVICYPEISTATPRQLKKEREKKFNRKKPVVKILKKNFIA